MGIPTMPKPPPYRADARVETQAEANAQNAAAHSSLHRLEASQCQAPDWELLFDRLGRIEDTLRRIEAKGA